MDEDRVRAAVRGERKDDLGVGEQSPVRASIGADAPLFVDRSMMRGAIYFAGNRAGVGAIKIGFSADPLTRLRQLNAGSPISLSLLALIAGRPDDEHRFHARHEASQIVGEWFARSPQLMRDIHAIEAGIFDVNVLPTRWNKGQGSAWWMSREKARELRDEGVRLVDKLWERARA